VTVEAIMCMRIEQGMPLGPHAAQTARDFVGSQLNHILGSSPRADVTDDARLIASELVTNAVTAGSSSVRVVLEVHRNAITLEILDDAPGTPLLRRPDPAASSGRGLLLVDELASAWGANPAAGGKTVWAILPVPERLTAALGCDRAASPSS
jgi:anti-sigma regulatory factor (Ser/Thr protein kinase)